MAVIYGEAAPGMTDLAETYVNVNDMKGELQEIRTVFVRLKAFPPSPQIM